MWFEVDAVAGFLVLRASPPRAGAGSILDVIAPDTRGTVAVELAGIAADGAPRDILAAARFPTLGRRRVRVFLSGGPAPEPVGVLIVDQEDNPFARALAITAEQLRDVLENVADGISVTKNREVLFLNRAARRLLLASDCEEKPPYRIDLDRYEIVDDRWRAVRPDDLPNRRALRGERVEPTVLRFRTREPGAEWRCTLVKATPIFSDGALDRAVTIWTDVTDVWRLEEERARREESEKEVRARERFLSVASHELRTPLTTLQLAFDAIAASIRSRADDERIAPLARLVSTAARPVRQMTALLEKLFDVSLMRSGRLVLEPREMDLSALVSRVVAQMGEAASRIVVDLPGPVVGIWDESRLEQVVMNLLTNALKFGQGKPVHVSVRAAKRSATLAVEDFGVGISEERRLTIFDAFDRGESGQRTPGLGLGLYVVRQIVEAHHGVIRVRSERGRGSRFEVELPRGSG